MSKGKHIKTTYFHNSFAVVLVAALHARTTCDCGSWRGENWVEGSGRTFEPIFQPPPRVGSQVGPLTMHCGNLSWRLWLTSMLKCMLWKEHNHRGCRVTSPHRCHQPQIQCRTMDHQECMSMAAQDIFGSSHIVPSDSPQKTQYCCPPARLKGCKVVGVRFESPNAFFTRRHKPHRS